MSDSRRLYRDSSHQVIGGVCYGLGTYLTIDPVVVRILFVLLAIFGGGGVLIYILLWIFVPEKPSQPFQAAAEGDDQTPPEEETAPTQVDPSRGNLIAGIILVAVGAIFLVDRFIPRIYFDDLWPLLLIIGGVLLLSNHFVKEKNKDNEL